MADRITIYDNLKERGLNLWDALSRSADEYFSSKPSFSPSQPFDMRHYVDGNYLPPLQDSVQRDVGNAVAKGVLDTVTNPVGYVKDLYYGIADPAVSAYENTSASLPYYGNAALQRLQGDDNTEAMNIADKYSANAITSLGLLGLGIADVLPSGKVTKPVKGLLDDVDELGFYSPTERLAATLQPKGTGQQYLGILSKGDGKGSRIQEEMQDMGLDTWLQNKGKVSRDEVLDYIGDNRLRYGEEVLTSGNPYPYTTASEWQDAVGRAERRGDFDEGERLTAAWESSEGLGAVGDSKYQKYAQKGGTGYQENLLTVPERNKITYTQDNVLPLEADHPAASDPERFWYFKAQDRGIDQQVFQIPKSRFNSTGEVSRQEAKDYIIRSKQPEMDTSSNYKSPHYDQSNIGLTTRTQSFNTPQGDSVHLMDELQSDWHQEGKKKGYRIPRDKKTFDALTQEKADRIVVRPTSDGQFQGFWTRPEDDWLTTGIRGSTEEEALLNTLGDTHDIRYKNATGVPNAPAKQSWINQGIKHEINQTIADGKDYFAWTGGDIQADRYSLRKQVEDIDYDIYDNTLSAYAPDGSTSIMETVELKDLDNFIGKEAADKIRTKIGYSDEQSMRSYYKQKAIEGGMAEPSADALSKTYTQVQIKNRLMDMDNAEGLVRLTGEELEVGGEGMKSFYDKDVKKRTEKIIKRLDPNAKVEVIELDNGNKVWGVKITDKMRDKVKGEGMPLYSIAPIAGAGLLGAGMMRQEDQQPQQGILN